MLSIQIVQNLSSDLASQSFHTSIFILNKPRYQQNGGLKMSHVSKLIYRELNNLIPNLKEIKPLEEIDLKAYGFADIHLIVLESTSEEISIILSHYSLVERILIANPSVEIVIYPGKHRAEVVIYKDPHFTYQLITENVACSFNANSHVNRLVYEWLRELRIWNCNKKDSISTWLLH